MNYFVSFLFGILLGYCVLDLTTQDTSEVMQRGYFKYNNKYYKVVYYGEAEVINNPPAITQEELLNIRNGKKEEMK